MNWWRLYWAVCFLGGLCTMETIALLRQKRGDTLSEAVWHWFRVIPGQPFDQWPVLRLLGTLGFVAIVCVWLTGHFWLHWWT